MKTTLYVNYQQDYESGGEICDGQENDAWPSYETTYYSFSVLDITLSNVNPSHEEVEWLGTVPDKLYVVWARYSDGNTFGRTSGYGSIEGVFEHEWEAQVAVSKIRAGTWRSPHGWCRWDGYFSSLEDVDYDQFKVVAPIQGSTKT